MQTRGPAPDSSADVRADGAARLRPADPIDRYIGVQIRLRRRIAGLTQEQLARQLGLTFQQLQKYETGANRIGAARLFRIACILQVSVSRFFPESAAPEGFEGDLPGALASSDAIELASAFGRIQDADLRRRLVVLVKSIAGSAS